MNTHKIWKYEIDLTSHQQVFMPVGSKILHVGRQDLSGHCLWALVDISQSEIAENRNIRIIGTGEPICDLEYLEYIGTVISEPFVWHVFESVGDRWL